MSNPVPCAHGANIGLSGRIKYDLLVMQANTCTAEDFAGKIENFVSFWTATAGRRRLIDAELADQYFAITTSAFLRGDEQNVRDFMFLGKCAEEIASQGLTDCDWFTEESRIDIINHICKYWSLLNIARSLAKKIPCSCLDDARKQAKAGPRKRTCSSCYAEFPSTDIKICLGCETFNYCSKQCQRAHWKKHKPICNKIRAMRKNCGETSSEASGQDA